MAIVDMQHQGGAWTGLVGSGGATRGAQLKYSSHSGVTHQAREWFALNTRHGYKHHVVMSFWGRVTWLPIILGTSSTDFGQDQSGMICRVRVTPIIGC